MKPHCTSTILLNKKATPLSSFVIVIDVVVEFLWLLAFESVIFLNLECLITCLLLQDNFGRLHDRGKETPKTMKQLSRLFPNKVTIQIPQVIVNIIWLCATLLPMLAAIQRVIYVVLWQDESMLSDWKQQLDRDIETLKSQSNIVSIRTVSCLWPHSPVMFHGICCFFLVLLSIFQTSLLSCSFVHLSNISAWFLFGYYLHLVVFGFCSSMWLEPWEVVASKT